jgi:hypothetical protein
MTHLYMYIEPLFRVKQCITMLAYTVIESGAVLHMIVHGTLKALGDSAVGT